MILICVAFIVVLRYNHILVTNSEVFSQIFLKDSDDLRFRTPLSMESSGDSSEDRTQLLPSTRRTTPATASTLEVKLAASRTTAFRLKIALAWVLVCLYPLVVAVSWASPRCRATVEERRVQAALDAFRFTDGFDWMRSPAAVYDACPSKARTTITHGVYPMLRELGCGHEVRFPHSHSHKPQTPCAV